MIFHWKSLLDLVYFGAAAWMQWKLVAWLPDALGYPALGRLPSRLRRLWVVSAVWLGLSSAYGVLLGFSWMPKWGWADWVRGIAMLWAIVTGGLFAGVGLLRRVPAFSPSRRRFLVGTAMAAPAVIVGAGSLGERHRIRVVENETAFPNLPADLDGLRIVQLSDIHLGPFLEESELRRAVAMANELRPHLALVTGDLITARADRLSDCLRALAGLQAEAGVLGCLGNHEIMARCQGRCKEEGARLGIEFLRREARLLRFGGAVLNVAGVDYQRMWRPYLVGAGELRAPGAFNLLLSHNPDVFPVAARQGWDLTLAGHTHGGQVTLGILQQYVNIARVFTQYVYGLYYEGASALYVNRGIGTVAVPARIGAPPEIALIRLCAT